MINSLEVVGFQVWFVPEAEMASYSAFLGFASSELTPFQALPRLWVRPQTLHPSSKGRNHALFLARNEAHLNLMDQGWGKGGFPKQEGK